MLLGEASKFPILHGFDTAYIVNIHFLTLLPAFSFVWWLWERHPCSSPQHRDIINFSTCRDAVLLLRPTRPTKRGWEGPAKWFIQPSCPSRHSSARMPVMIRTMFQYCQREKVREEYGELKTIWKRRNQNQYQNNTRQTDGDALTYDTGSRTMTLAILYYRKLSFVGRFFFFRLASPCIGFRSLLFLLWNKSALQIINDCEELHLEIKVKIIKASSTFLHTLSIKAQIHAIHAWAWALLLESTQYTHKYTNRAYCVRPRSAWIPDHTE